MAFGWGVGQTTTENYVKGTQYVCYFFKKKNGEEKELKKDLWRRWPVGYESFRLESISKKNK